MSENEWAEQPRRFQRRKNEIEAIRVTEDNAAEIAKWCGGQAVKNLKKENSYLPSSGSYGAATGEMPILRVPVLGEPLAIHNGEWLIKDEEGRYSAMSNKEFQLEFVFITPQKMSTSVD